MPRQRANLSELGTITNHYGDFRAHVHVRGIPEEFVALDAKLRLLRRLADLLLASGVWFRHPAALLCVVCACARTDGRRPRGRDRAFHVLLSSRASEKASESARAKAMRALLAGCVVSLKSALRAPR